MFKTGFDKISAPRWIKELKKNQEGFITSLQKSFAPASSTWAKHTEKAIKSQNPSRSTIAEMLFGVRPRRFHKDMPLSPKPINITEDIPISNPLRRSAYFKVGKKWYKQKLSIPPLKEIEVDAIDRLKSSAEDAKRYLNKEDKANFSFPFSSINSKDFIGVKHLTPDSNAKNIVSGSILRSPSAGHHAIGHKGIFAFPSKSKDYILFAGAAKDRAKARAKGVEVPPLSAIHYSVPENSVTYLRPNISTKQKDAEIYVDASALSKSTPRIKKLR